MTQPAPSSEPLFLVVDTSASRYGLALARGERLIAEMGVESPGPTAHLILSDIANILDRVGISPKDLDAVGALVGPGSFTGIRVGLATVKGLAQPLRLPIVTATTLETVARAVYRPDPDSLLCVVNVAYRDQVHAQIFRPLGNGNVAEFGPPQSGEGGAVLEEMLALPEISRAPVVFTGDAFPGLVAAVERILVFRPVEWSVVAPPPFLATAAVPMLAERLRAGRTTFARELEAFYARTSEPERKFDPTVAS